MKPRRNPRPVLTMHWQRGREATKGCFLRNESPRARTAYEIVEIRSSKRAPLGGMIQRLVCRRVEPKEIPEGATVFDFRWDKRSKR